jgi:hypothetical protein
MSLLERVYTVCGKSKVHISGFISKIEIDVGMKVMLSLQVAWMSNEIVTTLSTATIL